MYFLRAASLRVASLRAAIVLASVPAILFSASSHSSGGALANELPELAQLPELAPPADEPSTEAPVAPLPTGPVLRQTPVAQSSITRQRLPLSPGDRLRLTIPGLGGEEFTGEYEVNFNGELDVPFIEPVSVLGLVATEVEARLRDVFLTQQLFLPNQLSLDVQILDYAPIQIAVAGEVFEPKRILLSRETSVLANSEGEVVELPGDFPVERYLTSALKAIGGVKPTADVSKVQVLRGTESIVVDLSGVLTGSTVVDFPLISGDQVIVPDSGEFQRALVRPTQITPDTIDTYVSNVTVPGGTGALSGTNNINVASFEYGINLAQALVSARCVGGTQSTNANRRALLIQTDTVTGGLETSEYSINNLVSDSTESSQENPFLMPDDAIACYDSRNTNVRGVLGTVVDFLNPINLLINLFD